MPIYEYQGLSYDIAETDPQKAKAKILAHLGKSTEEPSPILDTLKQAGTDFLKGTGGVVSAAGDLAAGLGKTAAASIAAPIRTAIYGDANTQRDVAQQAAEGLFGTPSKGLEMLGVPKEYTTENAAYRGIMKPFELLSEGIEKGGNLVEQATGSREAAGAAKQLADVALLAAPIPGAKAVKKGAAKLMEPFVGGRTAKDIEAIRSGDLSSLSVKERADVESLKKFDETRAQEAKIIRDVEEQMKKEEQQKQMFQDLQDQLSQHGILPEDGVRAEEPPAFPTLNEVPVEVPKIEGAPEFTPRNEPQVTGSPEAAAMEFAQRFPNTERLTTEGGPSARNRPDTGISAAREEALNTLREVEARNQGQQERAGTYPEQIPDNSIPWTPPKEMDVNAAWEQHRAAIAEQAKANRELGWERAEAERAPLTLEPAQGTKLMDLPPELRGKQELYGGFDAKRLIEDLNTLFDKVTPKSFDEFLLAAKQAGMNQSDSVLKMVYDDAVKTKAANTVEQQRAAVAKIPGLGDKLDIYGDIKPEQALDDINRAGDADSNSLGFSRNNLMARGRLGLETIKNKGLRSGLSYMIGLRDKASIAANQMLHGPDGIIRDLRKMETLFTEGNAWEVLRQRMEGEFNPEYQYHLNPEQQKLNTKLDQMFETIRSRMEELTGKKIKQIPNYFPSMFYGDYMSVVKDADGRVVGYITEKSGNAAKAAGEYVLGDLGEGFTVSEPKFRKEMQNQRFRDTGGLANYFDAFTDLLSSDDPVTQRAQESIQRALNKRAMDTKQVKQRMKFKAGVAGAEGRKGWRSVTENYRDTKDVLENYVRGFHEWEANMETAKFLEQVKETSPDQTNTYQTMSNYFDDMRYGQERSSQLLKEFESSLANTNLPILGKQNILGGLNKAQRVAANQLTSLWLGWWNPAAMAQNVLQPIHTLPKLIELATNGGSKDIVSPLIIGMAEGFLDGLSIASNKALGTDLTQKAKYLRDFEVIKPGLVETQLKTKGGHYFNKGLISGGLLATEAFARGASFNIFRKYLENSGYDKATAMDLAKNLTHDYQVNYENYAKAGALSKLPGGELAGKLQSFKINQFTQLANYIAELKNNKNPAPLVAALSLSIAMAGMSGMIGMDVAEGLNSLAVSAGVQDPKAKSPRQLALDLGGSLATGVPTQATGKWLSGSLTTNLVGDMSWRNLAPVVFGAYDAASKTATVGAHYLKDKITGKNTLPQSEKFQLVSALTPTTLRGIAENRLLTDKEGRVTSPYTGEVTYQKGPQDQDLLSRFTNVRSKERGETLTRTQLLKEQNKRIAEKQQAKLQNAQKMVDESVRMGTKLDEGYLNETIQDILDNEGDPNVAIKKINDFTIRNHMGNWLERQVASGKVNLGNVGRKLRALDEQEKLRK